MHDPMQNVFHSESLTATPWPPGLSSALVAWTTQEAKFAQQLWPFVPQLHSEQPQGPPRSRETNDPRALIVESKSWAFVPAFISSLSPRPGAREDAMSPNQINSRLGVQTASADALEKPRPVEVSHELDGSLVTVSLRSVRYFR